MKIVDITWSKVQEESVKDTSDLFLLINFTVRAIAEVLIK